MKLTDEFDAAIKIALDMTRDDFLAWEAQSQEPKGYASVYDLLDETPSDYEVPPKWKPLLVAKLLRMMAREVGVEEATRPGEDWKWRLPNPSVRPWPR
jgi:hypothetical protein